MSLEKKKGGTPLSATSIGNQPVRKSRLLIMIVAYNAETSIGKLLDRIPDLPDYEAEILILDDASLDSTFEEARSYAGERFPTTVLTNWKNQGYGGNQKIGYHYALKQDFDLVAMLHGDGQYAPERLPDLLVPFREGRADAVFGSRMMTKGGALEGGMPLYKFVGNRVLSTLQNRLLGLELTEFHSGYRIYSTQALRRIPFELNANDFSFDTEIIIQLARSGARIVELPIPTHYGDEICHVNGMKYAWQVATASWQAKMQQMGLFYDPRFDLGELGNEVYKPKFHYASPHQFALHRAPAGARVLDLGCGRGHVAKALRDKGCHVVGVDLSVDPDNCDEVIQHDLNGGLPDLGRWAFDLILLLDVIEHLNEPEVFVDQLKTYLGRHPEARLVVSTGNIAFLPVRLSLLVGGFNYGKRGILDMTHTRLFTEASLKRLFEDRGFRSEKTLGIPAPFPLALGPGRLADLLLWSNELAIKLFRRVFSYQVLLEMAPVPDLDWLLEKAVETSENRKNAA